MSLTQHAKKIAYSFGNFIQEEARKEGLPGLIGNGWFEKWAIGDGKDLLQTLENAGSASMTEAEKLVLTKLAEAWDLFNQLPVYLEDDTTDFRYHIHRLQDMVAARQAIMQFAEQLEKEAVDNGTK